MKTKLLFATAAAVGVLMASAALAAESEAYLSQPGDSNDAWIDQAGTDDNLVGSDLVPATQQGDNNLLDVQQSYGSRLGVPAGSYTNGLLQSGDRNVLTALQKRGIVHQVTQTGADGATGISNSLNILQDAAPATVDHNWIGSITQTYLGSLGGSDRNRIDILQSKTVGFANHPSSIATITQSGTDNRLDIDQLGEWNTLATVIQDGDDNIATIVQGSAAGGHNYTKYVLQDGTDNTIQLLLNGLNNGGDTAGRPRVVTGNQSAVAMQTGSDNSIGLIINGDSNGYGIQQKGNGNIADGIVIDSDDNEIGIGQHGDNNRVSLATVELGEDGNSIALEQGRITGTAGDNNRIEGLGFGSDGVIDISQLGDSNRSIFSQDGSGNEVKIYIVGDSNFTDSSQSGTGSNTIDVDIWGNSNNAAGSFSGFARDAALAPATALTRGQLIQNGFDNSLTVDVGAPGAGNGADNNRFAFAQIGDNNTIIGDIDGTQNQAVIAQLSSGSTTDFVQSGSFNNLGVKQ